MSEHLALYVDNPVTPSVSDDCIKIGNTSYTRQTPASSYQPIHGEGGEHASSGTGNDNVHVVTVAQDRGISSEELKIEMPELLGECRICQEEDEIGNLESPCDCSGSLKFAHRKCVQHWCNEKGDTICEICRQPYESGYTAPPQPVREDGVSIDISANWRITGGHQQLNLHQPQLFAVAAERHFLENDYEEYGGANASSAACFRSAALILMALLLLRHTLLMTSNGADDDVSTFFMFFVLRAAGFLLPCYIMARAMNILQRRRQRQEAVMAAAEVAYLLQTRQSQGVHFAVSPGIPPA